jgi:hypothetical protein
MAKAPPHLAAVVSRKLFTAECCAVMEPKGNSHRLTLAFRVLRIIIGPAGTEVIR